MTPILLALLAQTTPVAPIVKGTALPPPGTEEAAVLAPVTALLAAISGGDETKALAATLPEGIVTDVATSEDGTARRTTMRWTEFAAALKQGGARVEERLGTPAIEIDGGAAMVWAPYTLLVGGTPHHCGYDHFDLVRTAAGWRILNTTYSRRAARCEAQP